MINKNVVNTVITKMIPRLIQGTNQSYFLFGPRGVGKSTWLLAQYPEAIHIDLLQPDILRRYAANPERLRELALASTQKKIIVDEIQKLPELLPVVHSLIEQKIGLQFILTGSSSRKLKRAGTNLLGGRAVIRHLHPFIAAELGQSFNLAEALKLGMIPLVYDSANRRDTMKAYIGLYLKEEVQEESLVRNIGNFSRFLETISFSHGSILNKSNVARDCGVSRKLIEGYVSILEDLLLCFQLSVFTRRQKRKVVSHPKFYYFDAGVFTNLRSQGPLDSPEEIQGPALEGLVAQHLRAWNDYQGSPFSLHYWRTRSGNEVDFIIYGQDGFWAIEVKNSKNIQPKDLHGLQAFCDDYPEATPILLYRGTERLKKKNILCIPVEIFLKNLVPDKKLL